MTSRGGLRVWPLVLVAVAGLATACYRVQDEPDTNVPESVEEACTWLDLPPQPPTREQVEAIRHVARDKVDHKYEVESTGMARCKDQLVLVIGIRSGEVSDADRAFTVDGVGVILIAERNFVLFRAGDGHRIRSCPDR
ncbi:hypothetical protein [uncultured Aeromicrobium sp.]|uniref:hypothetical protein n=1 Tax=uncultured Aeromicrobium sp. TaxID=337820 RepID=UPI0025CDE496|nr:hypothetical protein [uncultured Aeromicrobium sp.]